MAHVIFVLSDLFYPMNAWFDQRKKIVFLIGFEIESIELDKAIE